MSSKSAVRNLLTIAGSDSGGGAGVQADLKVFSALGAYGASVLTTLTAQNTGDVSTIRTLDAAFVAAQLGAVFSDISFDAVKVGALGNADVVRVVAAALRSYAPRVVVLDPVMLSKSMHRLLEADALEAMRRELLPLCTVLTPNLPEAAALLNLPQLASTEEEMQQQGEAICRLGARAVLMKGGHLSEADGCPDWLIQRDAKPIRLPGKRLATRSTHGTGCTLSSAIAVHLAQGTSLLGAVADAKDYVYEAMKAGERLRVGKGASGPLHHFHRWW